MKSYQIWHSSIILSTLSHVWNTQNVDKRNQRATQNSCVLEVIAREIWSYWKTVEAIAVCFHLQTFLNNLFRKSYCNSELIAHTHTKMNGKTGTSNVTDDRPLVKNGDIEQVKISAVCKLFWDKMKPNQHNHFGSFIPSLNF